MSSYDRLRSVSPIRRIRVACANCRKKKIRCDGATPCLNCTIWGEINCTYEARIPKPKRKRVKLSEKDDVIVQLNERLNRLEAMIQKSARPGPSDPLIIDRQSSHLSESTAQETNNQPNTSAQEENQLPLVIAVSNPEEDEPKQKETFVGNQSFFSILSKSSISWMKSRLTEDKFHLLLPLSNLPYVLENKVSCFSSRWFNLRQYQNPQILASMQLPLPENKQFMCNLVDQFLAAFWSMQALCLGDEITYALEGYYSSPSPSQRNLSITQMLKLYTALLICLSNAIEEYFGGSPHDGMALLPCGLSLQETHALRDKLIDVCMGFYFQLSVVGLGLEVVRSMLFFVTFLAKCDDPHDITLLILATAIRKAQEIGLNRIETYRACTTAVFLAKLLVWRLITYLDTEMCFRTGKPPIINYNDVSPDIQGLLPIIPGENGLYHLSLMTNYDKLSQIRLETYNRLFSALADTKTFDSLQRNVDYLNTKMFDFLLQVSVGDRPAFFNEPTFSEISTISGVADELRLSTTLTFFCNMMTINRLPLMFALPDAPPELLQMYKNLSLNSARTILHLLENFQPYGPGKATSLWITFYPLISVLHLLAACMLDPKSTDLQTDILLIAKLCKTWFNRSVEPDSLHSFKFDMTILLEVLVKSVANIAIEVFENKTGIHSLPQDSEIKISLEAPLKIVPELFGNEKTLKRSLPNIFASKSISVQNPSAASTDKRTTTEIHAEEPICRDSIFRGESTTDQAADFGIFGGVFDSDTNYGGFENLLFDQFDQYPNFFFDGMDNRE